MAKPKIIDPNIEITIKDVQSYKFDLARQTYTVFRIYNPDATIHFELSAKEKRQIMEKYYELQLNIIAGEEKIKDDCMIMPKLYTIVEVKSQ